MCAWWVVVPFAESQSEGAGGDGSFSRDTFVVVADFSIGHPFTTSDDG